MKLQIRSDNCREKLRKGPDSCKLMSKLGAGGYFHRCFTKLDKPELGRKIGIAKSDFLQLQKTWKHQIYKSLIESKLMYSLICLCLSAAEYRRLHGFQRRCLPRILGIAPAFLSRISNANVLRTAGCHAAGTMLLQRQLLLLGKALRPSHENFMHCTSFIPGSLQSTTSRYVRGVGRLRRECVTKNWKSNCSTV